MSERQRAKEVRAARGVQDEMLRRCQEWQERAAAAEAQLDEYSRTPAALATAAAVEASQAAVASKAALGDAWAGGGGADGGRGDGGDDGVSGSVGGSCAGSHGSLPDLLSPLARFSPAAAAWSGGSSSAAAFAPSATCAACTPSPTPPGHEENVALRAERDSLLEALRERRTACDQMHEALTSALRSPVSSARLRVLLLLLLLLLLLPRLPLLRLLRLLLLLLLLLLLSPHRLLLLGC